MQDIALQHEKYNKEELASQHYRQHLMLSPVCLTVGVLSLHGRVAWVRWTTFPSKTFLKFIVNLYTLIAKARAVFKWLAIVIATLSYIGFKIYGSFLTNQKQNQSHFMSAMFPGLWTNHRQLVGILIDSSRCLVGWGNDFGNGFSTFQNRVYKNRWGTAW